MSEHGPCECCGTMSRAVSGLIYRDGAARAGYQVHWTPGQNPRHGPAFYFFVGKWGETALPEDRVTVALMYREAGTDSTFIVVDASDTPMAENPVASRSLRRDEVIGTPLAQEVFDMVDLVWLNDGRIAEITGRPPDGEDEGEDEVESDFSDVPGFGGGPGGEKTPLSPPPRIILAGTWVLGSIFLATGVAVLCMDDAWHIKAAGAFASIVSSLYMVRTTRRFFASKRGQEETGPRP